MFEKDNNERFCKNKVISVNGKGRGLTWRGK